jgi:integrase/recombinase XerD
MATTSTVLDKRRAKKNGKYPVKLRVTHLKEQRYYILNIDLTEEDFNKANGPKPKGDHKNAFLKFSSKEAKAAKIISDLDPFSFLEFERKFLTETNVKRNDVYKVIEERIAELKKHKRIGTAISFENTLHSLQTFKRFLKLEDITVDFLQSYEEHLLSKDKSITTVGIYARNIRTIYNWAINQNLISADYYPFGKGKYEIPTSNNVKKALHKDQIKLLYNYASIGTNEKLAKDFWFLSYFLNGSNITDILNLKNKQLHSEFIYNERQKTQNTRRGNPKVIKIPLLPQAKEIINRYKALGNEDDYVFPYLKKGMSAERQKAVIQQFTKVVNKWMKKIAQKLEIDKPVTTYAARHSFATILKKEGTSIHEISEMLGHSDYRVTKNYLDSFEDEHLIETSNRLAAFL